MKFRISDTAAKKTTSLRVYPYFTRSNVVAGCLE